MIGTLLEKLLVVVGVDLSDLGSGLNDASDDVERAAGEMKRSFDGVGKSFQKTGQTMIQAGAVMSAAITAPLVLFGTHAVKAASDAQEMQSAFDVVFGEMAGDVREWAEATGDAMGRSTQEIQRGALAFQELFGKALDPARAAEMSKQFAVLTQDLASFKNLSNEVAQQKLFSGLTGEAEPLRAVGVFLNDAAVEAKLLELGIQGVNGKFTDQEKILGRAALIREQLAAADGDVIRTSDSLANKQRAAQAAYEELSVTVGTVLIPAITPLVEMLSDLLLAFNELDPGLQTFIVGAGVVAAAIGPLLVGIGSIVSAVGTLIPLLGSAGAGGAMTALGAAALPVTATIAGLVAAWVLFGDKIGPVLSELATKAQEVLGPKFMALVDTVTTGLTELWQGPFGDGLRVVIDALGDFAATYVSVWGEGLIRVISVAVDIVSGAFTRIVNIIKFVSAVLTGDFSGAWEIAKENAADTAANLLSVFNSIAPGAVDAMKRLVEGVREWIVGRLNAIWQSAMAKIEAVKAAFFDLYDAVVGNSYVPDMVDEIGENMARLKAVMVDPAMRATASTKDAFRSLASDVAGLLDELFPAEAAIQRILEKMAKLEKGRAAGLVDPATYDAARARLIGDQEAIRNQSNPLPVSVIGDTERLTVELGDLATVMAEIPQVTTETQLALQAFGERLGDDIMGGIADVLTGRASLKDTLKRLFSNFMEDLLTNSLRTLEKAAFGEGGLGSFLGNLFSSVIGGRAVGGPVVPGRAYTVGAGEVFQPSQTGRILSRNDAMRALGGGGGGERRIAITINGARGNQEIMEMVREGVAQGLGQYDRVVGSRVTDNLKRRS